MSEELFGNDRVTAASYVLAWWLGHPGEEDAFNAMEMPESHAYRDELYDKINAATEGRLSQLVDRRNEWTIVFGLACSRWGLMTPEERAEDIAIRSEAEHVYEELKRELRAPR